MFIIKNGCCMNQTAMRLKEAIDQLIYKARFDDLETTCKTALRIARERQDRETEAVALIGLAEFHKFQGKFREAKILDDGALDFARQTNSGELTLLALTTSASINLTGTYQTHEAEEDYRAALNLAHELDDARGMVIALAGLASTFNQLGEHDRAQRYAREAFEMTREDPLDGEKSLLVTTLKILGDCFAALKRPEQALQSYRDALGMAQQQGFILDEIVLIGALGRLYSQNESDAQDGFDMLNQALRMAQDKNVVPQEFGTLMLLGLAQQDYGHYKNAFDYYETMLLRAQTWNARAYEAVAFSYLGGLAQHQGEHDSAVDNFANALNIAQRTMNPFQEAHYATRLGLTFNAMHEYDNALHYFIMAHTLHDALENDKETRNVRNYIIMTYLLRLVDGVLRFIGLRRTAQEINEINDVDTSDTMSDSALDEAETEDKDI